MRGAAFTATLLTSVGLLLWLSTLTIPEARLAIDPAFYCGLKLSLERISSSRVIMGMGS